MARLLTNASYLNGQPLAKMEGANTYYYHNDHIATPQKMTDSNGTVQWSADYKPFGEAINITGSITNNLRFPGQYFDVETGLNYNYYRDYNPMLGRYLEADPLGIDEGNNHLFVYVRNNSIRYTDIYGLHAPPPLNFDPSVTVNECSGLLKLIEYTIKSIAVHAHIYDHMITDTWEFWTSGTNNGPHSHKQQIKDEKAKLTILAKDLNTLKVAYKAKCECQI